MIPVGGSSPLGSWGYLDALEEIREQTQARARRIDMRTEKPSVS